MTSLPLDPRIFAVINFWGISIFCLILGMKYVSSDTCDNLLQKKSPAIAIVLCVIWIIFLGLRPVHILFGDTVVYARTYRVTSPDFGEIDLHKEWLFSLYRTWCKSMGLSVNMFLFFIEVGYIGFMLLSFKKFFGLFYLPGCFCVHY